MEGELKVEAESRPIQVLKPEEVQEYQDVFSLAGEFPKAFKFIQAGDSFFALSKGSGKVEVGRGEDHIPILGQRQIVVDVTNGTWLILRTQPDKVVDTETALKIMKEATTKKNGLKPHHSRFQIQSYTDGSYQIPGGGLVSYRSASPTSTEYGATGDGIVPGSLPDIKKVLGATVTKLANSKP